MWLSQVNIKLLKNNKYFLLFGNILLYSCPKYERNMAAKKEDEGAGTCFGIF